LNLRGRIAPVWLMGLTNATFGMFGGMVAISLPEILADQHIPEVRIAVITATAMSPAFWIFLICPMLDVRFTRRFYAVASTIVAATFMAIGLANLHHLLVLEIFFTLGFAGATITQNALGGWLSTALRPEDESRLSAWFNIANIGGGGIIATVALALIHRLPLPLAAVLLGSAILLPLSIYPFIPITQPDARLARESFAAFFRDVLALLKRREVLIALALFLAPSGSFALTNILGGLGEDFHASSRVIALAGGAGVAVAGVVGSLIFPFLSKRMSLRPLYLAIGIVGACFTLSLLLLPRSPAVYALSMIGENIFQSLAITGTFAIAFETIGQNNPLAATTFSVLSAACNFPIVYMQIVDGRGYSWHGVSGSFIADASLGILACTLLALLLKWLRPSRPLSSVSPDALQSEQPTADSAHLA
jgi:PAT family beta-lactamase induction signal transducer AmpG